MSSSISSTSSVRRASISPRLCRSKKLRERPCRCRKRSVRSETMKRPATHSDRYSSQNDTIPSASVSPRYASTTHKRSPKSRGTSTPPPRPSYTQTAAAHTPAPPPQRAPPRPGPQPLVHEDLVHPDRGRPYRRPQGREKHYQGHPAAVGTRVGPEAPDDPSPPPRR